MVDASQFYLPQSGQRTYGLYFHEAGPDAWQKAQALIQRAQLQVPEPLGRVLGRGGLGAVGRVRPPRQEKLDEVLPAAHVMTSHIDRKSYV